MNKTLLILMSSVFVLAGCQDETPDKPLDGTLPEVVTESVTVVTEGAQAALSQATSSISSAIGTVQDGLKKSARNSLDWEGLYVGMLPCGDCTGIATSLTLNNDGTYIFDQNYLGKGEGGDYQSSGNFVWNSKGDTITLNSQDDSQQFFVGQNVLMMLDVDGNKVEGAQADNYNLEQQE